MELDTLEYCWELILGNLLYLALLRRSGDPAGLTFWTTVLAQPAALAGAIDSFLNSAEYIARF